jgi:cytoskeleton protein RodZ
MPTEPTNMTEQQEAPPAPEPGPGARLRTRRESLGISLETVAERTRIRRVYLWALEAERFEELPALAYAIGFLRTYADQLGLDPEQVVAQFRHMAPGGCVPSGHDDGLSPTCRDRIGARNESRRCWWLVLLVALGVVLAVWQFGLFERYRKPAPVEESPSAVTEGTVSGGDAVSVAHEAEAGMAVAEAAPPAVENGEAVADMASSAVESPVPSAKKRTPATDEGQDKTGVMTVPLPPGGAVFRVKSGGTGGLRIGVDGFEERHYDMYPEMAMSWSIRRFAQVRVHIVGGLEAWLDDRPLTLDGDAEVFFGQPDETP